MVITKHFAIHGEKYRRSLVKYILNPQKTQNLQLVSDYGMRNYLDFPVYSELVKMYQENFVSNDKLYEYRHDRQEEKQRKIFAHHVIQSFSPDDKLTPEEINRIGYETAKELTGGKFRFIVATHIDQHHIHNHILINSIDMESEKKLKWDYQVERNLRMVSDRISKIAGAKIIENRYSHRQYQVYRKTNFKYELKQRLYFLMEHSIDFEDFKHKASVLHLQIDFSHKHATFFMTDSDMKQVVRGNKLNRRTPYSEEFFRKYFAQKEIKQLLEFLLPKVSSQEQLLDTAKNFGLTILPKQKHVHFQFDGLEVREEEIDSECPYDVEYFQHYFEDQKEIERLAPENLQELCLQEKLQKAKKLPEFEQLWDAYQEYKRNRDAVHEFEVEVQEKQIEQLVDDGVYIKVKFGLRQEGLFFVPNSQLDIEEDKTKIYIRETSSYYIFHKDDATTNRYMKGRTLIRQLSADSQTIPYRKRTSLDMIKEKIAAVDSLIELNTFKKSYVDIKNELVAELAELELNIENLEERTLSLNNLLECMMNSEDISDDKDLQSHLAVLNIDSQIDINRLEKELKKLKDEKEMRINQYERTVDKLEDFIREINDVQRDKGIVNDSPLLL